MGQKRLVTMADIAASAGASSRDVALVLAADPRVPPELRQRIRDEIDATGYRPLEAIQTQLGRPLRLAVVLKSYRGDDPEADRFYNPVASAIAIACVKQGAEITQATMTVDGQYEPIKIPSALTDGSCDAAFLLGTQFKARAMEQVRDTMCPIVLVDGYSEGDALDSVVSDNVAGGRMAVEYLIEAGHSEIALLGTEPVCYPSMQGRRTGYAQALEARNLHTHFIDITYVLGHSSAIIGVDYIERHPAITALFCANDVVTVAFMQVARDAGFHIPADISLVGFDDIDLASLMMPALTTLAIDKAMMGRAGFALLAHRLEVQAAEPVKAVVMPRLVERESVAPPRSR